MDLHTPLRVELHTWIDGTPQHVESVVDVTRFVVGVSWTDSLIAPWTSINLQLAVPFRMIRDVIPGRRVEHGRNLGSNTNQLPESEVTIDTRYGYVPEPGFWVVIRNQTPFGIVGTSLGSEAACALAFGRCHSVSFGVMARQGDGNTVTMPVSIQAESFLAYMGRSQMQFAPQGKGSWGMDGFVWDIGGWNDSLTAMLKSILQPYPGDLLEKLWPNIVKLELPPSLTPSSAELTGNLGTLVGIVKDEATAAQWTPMRTAEVAPVMGGMQIPNMGALLPNHPSLLNFFLTTFYANHEAVEFFSTIDYPADGQTVKLTPLGKALGGAQPVVIYRLKPWIMEVINSDAVLRTSEAKDKAAAASKLTMDRVGIGKTASRTEGAGGVQWFEWARDEVVSTQMGWNDNARVNLTFGNWSAASLDEPSHYGLTGTPIVPDTTTIKRHGLRVYAMRWPFFQKGGESGVGKAAGAVATAAKAAAIAAAATGSPTAAAVASGVANVAETIKNVTLIDYNNAIIEMAWMMAGDGQRWCSGSLGGLYKPQVKPGHWGRVNFQDATLTFYIEAVSHAITVDQSSGHVRKDTTVRFSRGTLRHQDTPSYQFRLETRGSNPEGAPVDLLMAYKQGGAAGALREGLDQTAAAFAKLQEKVLADAKPLAGGEAVLYTASVPLLKPAKNQASPLKHCIVIHYTNGTTASDMLKQFNKQKLYKNKKTGVVESVYHTSTHYSVEADGRIIQWLDPAKYAANHVAEKEFPEKSIGIDVVCKPDVADHLPLPQLRALALLVQHLRSTFPSIPAKCSTPNTYYNTVKGKQVLTRKTNSAGKEITYTMADVTKNGYGLCRHRDFDATECPGKVPIESIPGFNTTGHTLLIQPLPPATQAELLALAKQYGLV